MERSGEKLRVTLVVEGTIISGLLTPEEEFLSLVNDAFMGELHRQDHRVPPNTTYFPVSNGEDYDYDYLHLTHAKVFGPSGVLQNIGNEFRFRVKASSVSAWMLGLTTG